MRNTLIVILLSLTFSSCQSFPRSNEDKFSKDNYIESYLKFSLGQNAQIDHPYIYRAISEAFHKIPEEVLEKVTDKKHPVVFTVNITTGIARFANASDFHLAQNKEKVFSNGFYLIKLADELENSKNIEAIQGIVLHELAHDYLDHLQKKTFSCEMEREANRLVKKWGFEKEYKKAKELFGSKTPSDSPCRD